jgi:hypothetical protein
MTPSGIAYQTGERGGFSSGFNIDDESRAERLPDRVPNDVRIGGLTPPRSPVNEMRPQT